MSKATTDERTQRYAEAIDAVLADEFLTDAVTRAVMVVVDAERAKTLREAAEGLREQLTTFPKKGAHTRAGWAVAVLAGRADEIEADQ